MNQNLADRHSENYSETSPLMEAVFNWRAEIVLILLKCGADANDGKNGLPLQTAVDAECGEIAYLLLEHGADVNIRMSSQHGHLTVPEFCKSSKGQPITNVILTHLIKRLALKQAVSEENEVFLKQELDDLGSNWTKELSKMKRAKFRRKLTVYEWLFVDVKKIAEYVMRHGLTNKLQKHVPVVRKKFPYLSQTVNFRMKEVMIAIDDCKLYKSSDNNA